MTLVVRALHKKWSFSLRIFFSKCDQIRSFLRIWSYLLKKSLIETFIFCVMRSFDFGQIVVYPFMDGLRSPNMDSPQKVWKGTYHSFLRRGWRLYYFVVRNFNKSPCNQLWIGCGHQVWIAGPFKMETVGYPSSGASDVIITWSREFDKFLFIQSRVGYSHQIWTAGPPLGEVIFGNSLLRGKMTLKTLYF